MHTTPCIRTQQWITRDDLPRHAPRIDGYSKAKIADLFARFSS